MQPPLTDLSWVTWLVWADWCADYRPKGERFARKVAKSLRKMEAVGCDPKMLLYSGTLSQFYTQRIYSPSQKWEAGGGWSFLDAAIHRHVFACTLYWVCMPKSKLSAGSPADLPKPLQDTRLAWKFWKCVNRRAMGIKDSVLEG